MTKLKTTNLLILVSLLFFHNTCYWQGLNNEYPADSIDLMKAMELIGLQMFKFPISSSEKCYLNIIEDEYRGDTLYYTNSSYEGIKNFPKEYNIIEEYAVDSSLKWLRIYWYDKSDSLCNYMISYSGITINRENSFVCNFKKYGYRAYDFTSIKCGEKKVLMLRYAKENVDKFEHCPGNRTIEEVLEIYDHVFAVSIELIKIE